MKQLLSLTLALALTLSLAACTPRRAGDPDTVGGYADWDAKPVLYLYPETETDVCVQLDYAGELTCTYPAYDDGWRVRAEPDGTLHTADGRTLYCLFWEGVSDTAYDLSTGWCVAGADTAAFLEQTLADLGLTEREANEFLIYWLPKMQGNAYNRITFQQETYQDAAKLTITPEPQSILRVFMVWQALDAPIELEAPPAPEPFAREGFTVVEWGGREIT